MTLSEEMEHILNGKHISWGYGDAIKYLLPKVIELEKENEEMIEDIEAQLFDLFTLKEVAENDNLRKPIREIQSILQKKVR